MFVLSVCFFFINFMRLFFFVCYFKLNNNNNRKKNLCYLDSVQFDSVWFGFIWIVVSIKMVQFFFLLHSLALKKWPYLVCLCVNLKEKKCTFLVWFCRLFFVVLKEYFYLLWIHNLNYYDQNNLLLLLLRLPDNQKFVKKRKKNYYKVCFILW